MKPQSSLNCYSEIRLAEFHIKGGLVKNLQKATLYFYPATEELSAKAVLKVAMINKDTQEEVEKPFSFRFDNFFDLQELIDALQVAKIKLGRATGHINVQNAEFRIQEDFKGIRGAYKQ